MAISLGTLRKKVETAPPFWVLYGVEGIGKTSLAAKTPNPVFLCCEEGLDGITDMEGNQPKSWPIESIDDCLDAIGVLYSEEHPFKTVVIDTADHLEPMIHQRVAEEKKVSSIEDVGYGKGYVEALTHWRTVLQGLNSLRYDRGMAVVVVAHTMIKRFDSPETDPYDRYMIKLHEKASALLRETASIVSFCNYLVSIRQSDAGFNKKIARGIGGGQRFAHFEERPAFQAKNRYGLPEKMEMKKGGIWNDLQPYFARATDTDQEAAA
jgi:hypothetical protein